VSVLTIHGVNDDNVYFPQAERITASLTATGADTRLVRVDGNEGYCHENCWKTAHARRAILEFLNGRLRHDGAAYFESVTKGK
jgi:dipeptidyl aminopeptidase/acylaminoacyl peptidase